ncbi:hypothetical protein M0G43_11680 [Subsaxibacter sp. CAU 1640]|uniref:hypothetical protein n=1 Tax=Subsaxibacter sp. CAU 1640 TaxID=2933271 RepID=UPI0020054BE7|nr:hypothetical protein [Subsaxibacter sp. CAU 1640]MCK7591237.1 hypothetical protein [Subsaxibacter sp. CAU 1640]
MLHPLNDYFSVDITSWQQVKMTLLKNKYVTISILVGGILNAIIGGFLIYSSFQGHSSFGLVAGAIIPLAALSFYGDGYSKYKNSEITNDLLKKIFKPTTKIAYTVVILMILLMIFIGFTENQFPTLDLEHLYFFLIILMIFAVPNLVLQIGYFYYLKKKI